MTDKQQAPIGQTYHEVLADHFSNLTPVHRKAAENAVAEHNRVRQRCAMLEEENAALIQDVAKLTRKLHAHEETPPKRAHAPNGNGNGNGRARHR
jgi:hypothetical protein